MRIVLACPYAWDAPGGVQVHVGDLARCLLDRGHDVQVLAPARRSPEEPWVRAVGRPIELPYNRSVAPICPSPASARRVREALRHLRPDVVHAHEPLTPSTSMFAVLSSPSSSAIVATFHAAAPRSRLFDLAAPALRRIARRIDVRIAVSDAARAFAAPRLGNGFRIVPNGTNIERFERARPAALPKGRWILFVGRLDPRKGFPVAVRAFGLLSARFPDLRLVVVGEGPDRAAVSELGSQVRERVLFAGHVSNDDLPPYHAAADVFIAPSLGGESFGIVLVEALAAGLPVVASDIPGYREVVRDGVEGLLVTPGDPGALADGLARVLEDQALSERLGETGRIRAQDFAWEAVTDRVEVLYGEAMERRRARSPLLP